MIELIATADSTKQAKTLIDHGVDTLYIGNDQFGLRLPTSFSYDEIEEITKYAHQCGKKVYVATNALMHNEHVESVVPYLKFLASIHVNAITVGDPGIIQLLKTNAIQLPFIYDAQTMVTSAKQINFWVRRGATGAVLARELTFEELSAIQPQVSVPVEVLVYGPTCIHHSKRPLINNYFNYTNEQKPVAKKGELFLSEAKRTNTHYSIYEDVHGTHVFATNDINLLPQLDKLMQSGLTHWKLDGLFTEEEQFVAIVKLFVKAKQAFEQSKMTTELIEQLNNQLLTLHPKERNLDTGFFLKNPHDIQ